jgi:hypothetical protein
MAVNPYPTRGACCLARLAAAERDHHLQACRKILNGPDTPGFRWLVRVLRQESPAQGPESLGSACQGLLLPVINRIREQLIAEFPGLTSGKDATYEPAKECPAPAGNRPGQ